MHQLIDWVDTRGTAIGWVLLALLFFVAAGLGVLSGNELRFPDEQEYHDLALRLVEGQGYVDGDGAPTAYRPPGYPFVLSLLYALSPQPILAKLLNAVALTLATALLANLAARLHSSGWWLVPLLALGYPVACYTASTLYPQTLGTLGLALILWLAAAEKGRWLAIIAASLVLGGTILMIPATVLITPLFAFAFWFGANGWKHAALLLQPLAFIAIAAAVSLCWTYRNYQAFDTFIPVSTNSGINILLGNSPYTGANTGVNVDLSAYDFELEGLDELEKNRRYQQLAFQWIQQNPGQAASLYLRKVLNYFNFSNKLATESEASVLKDLVLFVTYYPLLLLALLRLFWVRRYPLKPLHWACYAIYFGNALASAIFFTRIRFRVPYDAVLIVLAALALAFFIERMVQDAGSNTKLSLKGASINLR